VAKLSYRFQNINTYVLQVTQFKGQREQHVTILQ